MLNVKVSREDVLTINGLEVPGGNAPRFTSLFRHVTPKAKMIIGEPEGHTVKHPSPQTHYVALVRTDQEMFDMLKQFVHDGPVDMETEEVVIIRDDGLFNGKRYAEIYHVIKRPERKAQYDDE
ncbi:hypothetical protein PHOBOS_215 [Erwinia phage vB_EamM_Phobos]|uniref:hypothetical protein n=1 Tax=Erwinia phage vB_EamM_Phobos TaxID=1883377 RepID=UPI00081C724D|nr:hypothetical protein BIZ79_gp215 [Erwinia phage vB_EamM_Phobos]ANZ50405.1 hypothetical protein PHOBOS_215 [Erwinia phage vB_EamM_Phobos]